MSEYICKEIDSPYGGYLRPGVELIRCRDCKYFGADGHSNECEYMAHTVFENDYCSNAERKEE